MPVRFRDPRTGDPIGPIQVRLLHCLTDMTEHSIASVAIQMNRSPNQVRQVARRLHDLHEIQVLTQDPLILRLTAADLVRLTRITPDGTFPTKALDS